MAEPFATIPDAGALRLRDARVPLCLIAGDGPALADDGDGLARVDLDLAHGRIAAIRAHDEGAEGGGGGPGGAVVDLDGGQVWPCFVDLHTHLDKGHIWPRAENPDGSRDGALSTTARDRGANWSAEDVRRRMAFSLRCAYAHGTGAIRTHIDSYEAQYPISWRVLAELQAEWSDRIALQGSALVTLDSYREAFAEGLADAVAGAGGILGAVCMIHDDADALFDRVFRLAAERGLALDFHVDETGDAAADSLMHVARAALRHRFDRPIVVGHCCSLAVQPADKVDRVLDLVAEARLRVVSLPMCNLFIQDRGRGRTPRWRGVTLLHEMKARGIAVSIASDNTRDPFYGYGDLDGVEVFTQAARIAHLDRPVGDWPMAVTRSPADAMELAEAGRIAVGGPADLLLFRARHYSELLSRPQADRAVLRRGRPIDAAPPDYRELDDLF